MKAYKILAINPGSTSTKVGAFDGDQELFKENVVHSADMLAQFPNVSDQTNYRRQTIEDAVRAHGMELSDFDAFAGRGGSLVACEGGVYEVNELLVEHASSGKYGGNHPARFGELLAYEFGQKYGKPAFEVNGPDTDEYCDEARITGLHDVFRRSHIHTLNQKETALRVSAELGREYEKSNYIVAHLGGGVSITAHCRGRMIDSNDIINGDGPMTPTRSGALPANQFMQLCYSGKWTKEEMYKRLTKTGGFVDHTGSSDMQELKAKIDDGDEYAALIYRAFIYQVAKQVGSMAAVVDGQVDAIILTGGISHDEELVEALKKKIGFIAPLIVRPGEFELEALAAGALRVLNGEEQPKTYTGIPVFTGFDHLRRN